MAHNAALGGLGLAHAALRGVEGAGQAVRNLPPWMSPLLSDKSPISINKALDPYVSIPVEDVQEAAQKIAPVNPSEERGFVPQAEQMVAGIGNLVATGGAAEPLAIWQSGIDRYDEARKAGLSHLDAIKTASAHALGTGAMFEMMGPAAQEALGKVDLKSGGFLFNALRKGSQAIKTGAQATIATAAGSGIAKALDAHASIKDLQKIAGSDRTDRESLTNGAAAAILSLMHPGPVGPRAATEAPVEAQKPMVDEAGQPLGTKQMERMAAKYPDELRASIAAQTPDEKAQFENEARAKYPNLKPNEAAIRYSQDLPEGFGKGLGRPLSSEEPHPAQAQIDEQKANQSRIRELDEKAKTLRQKGRGQASLPMDQERIALLKRQQDLTLEIALRNAQAAHGGMEPATQDPDGQRAFRLSDPRMQDQLKGMAAEVGIAQEGGQPVISSSSEGTYSERVAAKGLTKHINNAEWWDERPSGDTHGADGRDLRALVAKVSDNPSARIGGRQKEMLDWMMDKIERERMPPDEGGFPWEDKPAQQAALTDAFTSEKQANGFPARDARLDAEKTVNGHVAEAKEAGLTPDFTKPPEPPKDPPDTPSALPGGSGEPPSGKSEPISKSAKFQAFMTGLRGNKAVNLLRAKMDQIRQHAELRDTLNLSPKEKLIEAMQPPGKGKYAELGDAMSLYINMLRSDGTSRLDEQLAKFGDKLTDAQMKVVGDTGRLTPQQKDIIQRIVKANDDWGQALKDAGRLRNVLDVYSGLKWKDMPGENERPSGAQPRFSTFSVHAMPRTYESILEGWANGRELAIRNPIDAQYEVRRSTFEAAENARWIKEGRSLGYFSPFAAQGRSEIEHPGFRDWADAGSIKLGASHEEMAAALSEKLGEPVPDQEALKIYGWSRGQNETSTDQLGVYGRDLRIMSDGQNIRIMERKKLWAPNDVATLINREFGKRPLSSDGVFRGINAVQKTVRRSLFALSQFHQIATTQHFLLGKPLGDADVGTPLSYRDGYEQLANHDGNVEYLVRNGNLRPLPQAEYEQLIDREHTAIGKKLDEIPGIGQAKNLIQNQLANLKQFTFQTVIPGFQVKGALLDQALMRAKGQYNEDEIARAVGRVWNNAVGVSNPDIVRRPLWSDIRSMGLNAPQWTGGAYRRFVDMAQAGATGELQRAFMGRAVSKYVLSHIAWHMAMASIQNPQHPVDAYWDLMKKKWGGGLGDLLGFDMSALAQKLGRTDPRRFYIGASGNLFEPAGAGLIAGGVQMLRAHDKTGPIAAAGSEMEATMGIAAKLTSELLTGTNWKGESYTTTPELHGFDEAGSYKTNRIGRYYAGESKGGKLTGVLTSYQSSAKPGFLGASQYESFALSQARENAPIPVQGVLHAMQGSMDAMPALLAAMGFRYGYGPKDEGVPKKTKR